MTYNEESIPESPTEAPSTDALIVQLPDSDLLETTSLNNEALESLVVSMLGGQQRSGINKVILKGWRVDSSKEGQTPSKWTIWSRDC